ARCARAGWEGACRPAARRRGGRRRARAARADGARLQGGEANSALPEQSRSPAAWEAMASGFTAQFAATLVPPGHTLGDALFDAATCGGVEGLRREFVRPVIVAGEAAFGIVV